jgi:serine/threonine-protein kinase
MAPEQMRNAKGCDERSDLWALGIILYELLTGVPPYDGESVHEVVANVLEQNRVKLSVRLPSVPPELDALVEDCLVLDPKKRIASVAYVAERIAPFGPPGSAEAVARVRALLGVLPSEPLVPVAPGPATQRSSHRDVDAIATAKTEEHLGVTVSSSRPLSGNGRLALGGALVFLGVAGVALALGLRRPVAVAGAPELPSASSVVATAPPSVTSVQASAVPTPTAASPSASIESPPVVASAPPKKIDKPAQVAVAASTSPQPASAPPPTSRPTAPATGGIVPISTMGIK